MNPRLKTAMLVVGVGCAALLIWLFWTPKQSPVSVTFHGFKSTPSGELLALFTFTNHTARRFDRRRSEIVPLDDTSRPIVLDEWVRGSGGGDPLEPWSTKNLALPVSNTQRRSWRLRSTFIGQPGKMEQMRDYCLRKARSVGIPVPGRLFRPLGVWAVETDWIAPPKVHNAPGPDVQQIARPNSRERLGFHAVWFH